jgi:hypothetical protein
MDSVKQIDTSITPTRRRLARFRDVPQEDKQRVSDTLCLWSLQVHKSGGNLPSPGVFANDEGLIEFEWHLPTRQLFVTLTSPGCAKVIRLEQAGGVETETEHDVSTGDMLKHLLWVLGKDSEGTPS